ncbi:hypothetical protein LOK49_LG09G00157 [Camellia lanceoleosa]|uniref:Uncharacterized protein n=1 Tax=Camellia lanceoleosa TaxID=1840588 RepID=A0ACC0GKG3_9ERIC|nr:hypothetical protein LOK49_LG09G00157 [Camellia lanceoleosa]
MSALASALSACQDKMGTRYLSAFPPELFDCFEAIKPVWAPYYTIHKILAGLLDQHIFANNDQALKMVTWMVDYFYKRVQNVIVKYIIEKHWLSLNEETDCMNDVLYRLYTITVHKTHLGTSLVVHRGTAFGTSSSSKGDTGMSFGTSSSSRGDYDWFETAVISFFKLFGENYDYELLKKRKECERLVGLYKECETNKLSDCDYHLERRPEGCSDFNKEEFLQTLRAPNPKSNGTSFGTSSSSREDYDWFETAVISFFKLFGENYDYELLKKRKECERLVGLYKECKTNKLSNCDLYLKQRPEGCPDFNKEEFLQTLRASNQKSNGKNEEQLGDQSR